MTCAHDVCFPQTTFLTAIKINALNVGESTKMELASQLSAPEKFHQLFSPLSYIILKIYRHVTFPRALGSYACSVF